jgi:moderate conductance mechanosensitive channel
MFKDLEKLPFYPVLAQVVDIGLELVLIIAVTWIALRLSHRLVAGIVSALLDRESMEGTSQSLSALELQKRRQTIQGMGTATIRVVILIIAGLMALQTLNPRLDIGPAIAGLGVVGVALGFGAQSLVKDYLAGAFILMENHFGIGDVVSVAGVSGVVEDFTLRRTTLRDLDGTVHSVPNGLIGVASNMTRGWSRVNLDITVAYGTDIDRVTGVIDEVGRLMAGESAWNHRVLEAPRVERVEALGEYGITIKILGTVRASDRWAAAGELRKRILAAFAEHGIEIPRPQRVIIAPPVDVPSTDAGPTDADLAPDQE